MRLKEQDCVTYTKQRMFADSRIQTKQTIAIFYV